MAKLIQTPVFMARDLNGNAIAGAKIYTYVTGTGTDTPKVTYTDHTGSTPAANPIICNSRGEATVWGSVGAGYKLKVYDASDVLQYTVDPYYAGFSSDDDINHDELQHLTWSTAGHTIDADIEMGTNKLCNDSVAAPYGEGLYFDVDNNGNFTEHVGIGSVSDNATQLLVNGDTGAVIKLKNDEDVSFYDGVNLTNSWMIENTTAIVRPTSESHIIPLVFRFNSDDTLRASVAAFSLYGDGTQLRFLTCDASGNIIHGLSITEAGETLAFFDLVAYADIVVSDSHYISCNPANGGIQLDTITNMWVKKHNVTITDGASKFLKIYSDADTSAYIVLRNATTTDSGNNGTYWQQSGLNCIINNQEAGYMDLRTNNISRLLISSAGVMTYSGANLKVSETDFTMTGTTSDAADIQTMSFCPGGAVSQTRGAYAILRGNETLAGGACIIGAGAVAGGTMYLQSNGANRLSINYDGTIDITSNTAIGTTHSATHRLLVDGSASNVFNGKTAVDLSANANTIVDNTFLLENTITDITYNTIPLVFRFEGDNDQRAAIMGYSMYGAGTRLTFLTSTDIGVSSVALVIDEKQDVSVINDLNVYKNVYLSEASNIEVGTTTGTKIGTSASQKLAFYNATPVTQRLKASYNNWAAVGDVVNALVALGLFDQA